MPRADHFHRWERTRGDCYVCAKCRTRGRKVAGVIAVEATRRHGTRSGLQGALLRPLAPMRAARQPPPPSVTTSAISTRTDLVPSRQGRPAIVQRDGWTEYVAIHDDAFQAERRAWRQRLAAAHPDAGGSAEAFRQVYRRYQQWVEREEAYYRRLGLPLPGQAQVPPPRGGETVCVRCKGVFTTTVTWAIRCPRCRVERNVERTHERKVQARIERAQREEREQNKCESTSC